MIVAALSDPHLRTTVARAARSDEDVIFEEGRALDALERGYPRLLVTTDEGHGLLRSPDAWPQVPRLLITRSEVEGWESRRKAHDVLPPRGEFHARLLRATLEAEARTIRWVDRIFQKLAGAAGGPLPAPLRGFGRRVLEHPSHYTTLRPVTRTFGRSDQALKGRFRRRGLASPSTYLRWFRAVAVAETLAGMRMQYREGAYHLGFASSANMCRFVETTTGLSTARLTIAGGRDRLLARFVGRHLRADALEGWARLEDLRARGAA